MKGYVKQKATQALEELAKDAPLSDRLHAARFHLGFVNTEHYMEDAPEDVQYYMRRLFEADIDTNATAVATACVGVIVMSLTAATQTSLAAPTAAG